MTSPITLEPRAATSGGVRGSGGGTVIYDEFVDPADEAIAALGWPWVIGLLLVALVIAVGAVAGVLFVIERIARL